MQFALGTHGAYFIETAAPVNLEYLDFATCTTKVLVTHPGIITTDYGLTVSPDEQWLLWGKTESASSQLMLVERFR